ncbi:MAG: molybdopterin-dependent oxidoreductase [Chloroflexi bacterium]|nr:molybdopterin-dependent oxidoreductase [Chloroflexota bacterium]MCI0576485.1 molybdopterin-dependent oxidoreductase [Chloroflexota bacterium]MCI0649539.1 molybdopterin-dependent oxidoreductase [Chloroflexota bacterium]MCI0729385.1 molybdopterin-dependent oxidoreductase [Chloroflexota bacterium]
MKQPSLALGALLGGLTSLPVMALSYLAEQLVGLPFVPFAIFDWLARVLPGDVVTLGIDAMVELIISLNLGPTSEAAKSLEKLLALLLFLFLGVVLGTAVAWATRRAPEQGRQMGVMLGFATFFFLVLVTLSQEFSGNPLLAVIWLAILLISWGSTLGALLAGPVMAPADDETRRARRDLLLKLAGGSVGVALGAWGLGRLLAGQAEATGAGRPLAELQPTPAATATRKADPMSAATLRDQVAAAPGTRPELTANEAFYRIDINTRPPVAEKESWRLEVAGLFTNPGSLTLEELMAYPAITQPITLSCISNRVGGDLIGTSNWTGVRLRDLVMDLGLRPEARSLYLEAADGFYESVGLMDIMDPRTLLVYGMNGETLPLDHGFPLRVYIPNRYGMKQPKWIVKMTALDGEGRGYWVDRGWSKEARPQIVSVIDTVATGQPAADGRIPIGGIAWAGDRGIQKVELQFDGGEWVEATLRTPPLSPLTWVQWRYDWVAPPGSHTIRVRATDGTGLLQTEEEQGVRPDGATGYHSQRVRI